MFRLSRWASRSRNSDAAFAARPTSATASISPDAISGGSDSRRQASKRMNAATPNRRKAFVTAARISTRR